MTYNINDKEFIESDLYKSFISANPGFGNEQFQTDATPDGPSGVS